MGNGKKVTVVLKVAECHTMPIPDGMVELLTELCQRAGYSSGIVEARLGRQKYGTPVRQGLAGISVARVEGPNAVVVTVQPGSNNTHHEVLLTVPVGVKSAEEFRLALAIAVEAIRESERPNRRARMLRRMRQLYRHFEGKNIVLSRIDEELAKVLGFQEAEDLRAAIQAEANLKGGLIRHLGNSNHEFVWVTELMTHTARHSKTVVHSAEEPEETTVVDAGPSIEEQVRFGLLGEEDATRLLEEACQQEEEAGKQAARAKELQNSIQLQEKQLADVEHQIAILEAQLTQLRRSRATVIGDLNRDRLVVAHTDATAKQAANKSLELFGMAESIVDAVQVVSATERVEEVLEELPIALRKRVVQQLVSEEAMEE